MDKKKISVIVEIVIFLAILGGITFFYYFSGNDKKSAEEFSKVGIIKVNDENFEAEVLKSDKPVVLEFSSNMCPPCLTMVPTLISIAKNNQDIKTAEKYEVEATPTIMILKDGEVVKTFVGATTEATIMQELK